MWNAASLPNDIRAAADLDVIAADHFLDFAGTHDPSSTSRRSPDFIAPKAGSRLNHLLGHRRAESSAHQDHRGLASKSSIAHRQDPAVTQARYAPPCTMVKPVIRAK